MKFAVAAAAALTVIATSAAATAAPNPVPTYETTEQVCHNAHNALRDHHLWITYSKDSATTFCHFYSDKEVGFIALEVRITENNQAGVMSIPKLFDWFTMPNGKILAYHYEEDPIESDDEFRRPDNIEKALGL